MKDWSKWLEEQGIEVKLYGIPYQREWQREKKAIGLCVTCGKNRIHFLSKSRCEDCLARNREAQKKYFHKQPEYKGKKPKGGKPRLTKDSNDLNKDSQDEHTQASDSSTLQHPICR